MRLRRASLQWLLLMFVNITKCGDAAAKGKQNGLWKPSPVTNSLMEAMAKKYSYPKNEVTAGVGYGHHLHPFYYRGQREMMYPCAVECEDWKVMDANDATSNVDTVTVRPDISTIEITTPESRRYKDIALSRLKKYDSFGFTSTTSKPSAKYNDKDTNGFDVQPIPQESTRSGTIDGGDSEDVLNDGSLYAKLQDKIVGSYARELSGRDDKPNEYMNPLEESMRYNSPSFDDGDSGDMDAPGDVERPRRERVEERYVNHKVREESLEDVQTNAFDDNENEPESHQGGHQSPPSRYGDGYATRKPYYSPQEKSRYRSERYRSSPTALRGNVQRPFRPSPPQPQIPNRNLHGKALDPRKRPSIYGRQVKYYQNYARPYSSVNAGQKYEIKPYRHYGYAHHHSYDTDNTYVPGTRYSSMPANGIQIVEPPRRLPFVAHRENWPRPHSSVVDNGESAKERRVILHRTIPRKDGCTRIVKKYQTFVDRTPQRYSKNSEAEYK